MAVVSQRSLAGGEIAPSLYARTDIAKYITSLRTLRNMFVLRQGGAKSRAGTTFVTQTKFQDKKARLIPFIFNDEQTYVLEFGEFYMRAIKNGAVLNVSGITAWADSTSYVLGDVVSQGGVNYYCILAHTSNTANDQPGIGVNFLDFWYALTGTIFEIETPYSETELPNLKFDQSADLVTLTHPSHEVRELSRFGDVIWSLAEATFAPSVQTPTSVSISGGGGGTRTIVYHITAIDPETFEESLAGIGSRTNRKDPSSSDPQTITWDPISGIDEFNVYMEENGIAGFIGIAGSNTFTNTSNEPDTTDTPPTERNPFEGTDNFPSTSTYHQQRHIFANTNNDTELVELSRSSNFRNFTKSSPIQDDDSIMFRMSGVQVNRVQSMMALGRLIIMTSSGEWIVKGDESGIIRPADINLEQVSYFGSAVLRPLLIGNSAVFLQSQGSIVRSLINDSIDGYTSDDLTIFSAHLFDNFTIVDWDYQETPNTILWGVRSDGTLLGFTYLRSQELFAWHRHDTAASGKFENVVVVPESGDDVPYFIIQRTINGSTVRYIERLNRRFISNIKDFISMDSTLSLDGTNTTATTMTLTGGTDWDSDETLTLTSSTSFFVSGDVGNEIHLVDTDGTIIRCEITVFTSDLIVSVKPNKIVPVGLRNTAILTWGKAVDEISGLSHLEGENVSVFADGFVEASPNNESYDILTVTSGAITLSRPYVTIHVGLPIIHDIETLNIDIINGETLANKNQNVTRLNSFVEETRGFWSGSKPPTDDSVDPLEGLLELKIRSKEGYDDPVSLTTDIIEINIKSQWNSNGRVFIRQVDPVPLGILSIVPSGFIPFARGRG